jgi:gliding motility-associated-like protein
VSFNNVNQNNATVSSLNLLGVYVFKWTISNGICPASESTVSITRETGPSPANAGLPQIVCAANAFLTGNNPTLGTGAWTVESGGATIVNPSSSTTQVTNLAIGPNVFRWTITGTTCPSTSSLVTITRLDNPTTATVQNNFSVCTNIATLNGNTPTVGTGQWVVVSGGASVNSPNNPTTQVSNLAIGPNVFKWVISNGSCAPSEATITVTRESSNTTADAGQPQSLCVTSATLMANNPAVGTGVWTVEGGGATVVNPNSNITQVNNLSVGPNIFRWTINSATCPSTFSLVTITRFADPTVATVANNFEVCATTANLNGNTPTIGTGQWVVVSGEASVNSPNNPTSQVSNLSVGPNVFKWVISNGNCTPTEATVTITRLANPSPANAGENQEVCATTATLSANNPSIGIGTWTVVSGSANINSPSSFISGVTNLSVGDNVFRWTVSNGICNVSESTVIITRYAVPTVANAGADISTCGGTSITLDAVSATTGIGTWTQLSGPSSAIFVNTNSPNTQVNGLIGGIYTFRWRVTNGVCTATQDEVTATVVPNPNTSANLVVQDLTICEAFQANINITVSNTQAGVTYELRNGPVVLSSVNSNGGLITFTIPSPTTTPAPSTTYTYDIYAVPAALNNVQCPPLLLIDKSIVKVDICNNPIANRLLRTTDFCTLLNVNVIIATENNNDVNNFTTNPISNFVTLAGGVVNMDFNGKLTYLPRTDFIGVDSVAYTICNRDNPTRCSTGKLLINILPCTNDAPNADNDSFNTDNCNVVRGNALDNDSDPEDNPLTVIPSTPILTAGGGVFDIQADGSFQYTPKSDFIGQDSVSYTACDNGDNGTSIVKCDEAKIFFNVVECEDVFVPDGFSPNGDRINDTFVIVGAERYDILLRVYDRWGNLLYESQHYLNDWDGRPNRGLLSNSANGLPDGTYFYIADFRDGKKPRTSYLIIQR